MAGQCKEGSGKGPGTEKGLGENCKSRNHPRSPVAHDGFTRDGSTRALAETNNFC